MIILSDCVSVFQEALDLSAAGRTRSAEKAEQRKLSVEYYCRERGDVTHSAPPLHTHVNMSHQRPLADEPNIT